MVFSNGDVSEDYGISGISCYFPATFVRQERLEEVTGDASMRGKYTKGLGQTEMAFCSDKEDSVSVALTVTQMLLDEYQIDPLSVGYLAVASESLVDKSKSIKSALMMLFPEENRDIVGVDVKHACYGGTQALFDGLAWLSWTYPIQHRYAIVVCSDIAVYSDGPARCTGGAGAMALLLSPGAPLVFDRGLESTDARHAYDFFKPVGAHNSEYPIVASQESISSYLSSLGRCYRLYKAKAARIGGRDNVSLADFDAACFHSPYTALVRKAVHVMVAEDAKAGGRVRGGKHMEELVEKLRSLDDPSDLSVFTKSKESRAVLNELLKASEQTWTETTSPNLEMNRRLGNMYTPSLYVQLVGYLSRLAGDEEEERKKKGEQEEGRRILMYSYGSGSMASVFSFTLNETRAVKLRRMIEVAASIVGRLEERVERTPEEYAATMTQREHFYTEKVPSTPSSLSSPDAHPLFPGTYYLASIDAQYRRHYARVDKV